MTKANINRSQTAMSTKSYDAGDECHRPLHEAASPFPDLGVMRAGYIH